MTRGAFEVPAPGAPVFTSYVRVRFHEVDSLGHVNNASYLNYLEQAAIDHALLLGLDMERLRALGGVFVARRHAIEFLRPARMGDLLRVTTWLGAARAGRVERHYLIHRAPAATEPVPVQGALIAGDGVIDRETLLVAATTEWVFVSECGQPRRIPTEIVAGLRAAGSPSLP
jgi:acyl-CoA thioester hydrolase